MKSTFFWTELAEITFINPITAAGNKTNTESKIKTSSALLY